MSKEVNRKRKTSPTLSMSDYLKKHSPIKKGVVVKNEDKPLAKYNKIFNRIYLGNFQAAKDKDFIKDKNITAVLNCTKDIPHHFQTKENDIEYMRIPVDDSLKKVDFDKMINFFPAAIEFIHKHSTVQKNNVFIHCYAGRQRSAICLAAFLVNKQNMNPHEACKYILQKRPESFHYGLSLNFDSSLEKYYKDLKKK